MNTLILEAGSDTEDLAQFILSALDEQTIDEIDVTRTFAPSEGVASEPITVSIALIGLATTAVPAVGRLLQQWLEQRRQQKAVEVIIRASESSPELAATLADLEKKHSEISVAFAEHPAPSPKPATS
jgi:hypothetical protein